MGFLRFLLAVSVVINHTTPVFGFTLVGGQVAVQAFFIISGFYMTLILREKYIGPNASYKLFITNRLLRLYPIYWIVLLLTIVYSIVLSVYTHGEHLGRLTTFITYFDSLNFGGFILLILTNVFMFFQDVLLFFSLDTSNGGVIFTPAFTSTNLGGFLIIPQAWTIGIELAFYLIAPFLVRQKVWFVVVLVIFSLLLRLVLFQNGFKNDPWSYRFFPSELLFFLLGIIAYHVYKRIGSCQIHWINYKISFFTILSMTLFYNFLSFQYSYFLYFLTFLVCLPFVFLETKNWKFDSYIGELSYPIYISHLFILVCIKALRPNIAEGMGIFVVLLTILFSLALNEVVSKRIEKIRQKRLARAAILKN